MRQSLQPYAPRLPPPCEYGPHVSRRARALPCPCLQSPHFAARVTEEYVYIAETDHLMLRPLPNLATRSDQPYDPDPTLTQPPPSSGP